MWLDSFTAQSNLKNRNQVRLHTRRNYETYTFQYFYFIFMTPVFAQDYFLEIEKVCHSSGSRLKFECKNKTQREQIFSQNLKWYGRNEDDVKELKVLKEDEYILVLANPVLFSGADLIHIIKPTGKFYWVQVAYSEVLNESETTTKYGNLIKIAK